MATLVFIDTNVMLDFYRTRGREGSVSLLRQIDTHRRRIITTEQVEMEYKKHRLHVIRESIKGHGSLQGGELAVPAFLKAAQPARMISKSKERIRIQSARLKTRLTNVLVDPTHKDPVYQVLQRLFRDEGEFHLSRQKKIRHQIRRRAFRRFIMGYPPRKANETSMGDAINWEWVVHCAVESGEDVVIVSRDGDYGDFEEDGILNDWLRHEFKERVGRRRNVTLTPLLAKAYKIAGIAVSKREQDEEKALVRKRNEVMRSISEVLDRLSPEETMVLRLRSGFEEGDWVSTQRLLEMAYQHLRNEKLHGQSRRGASIPSEPGGP